MRVGIIYHAFAIGYVIGRRFMLRFSLYRSKLASAHQPYRHTPLAPEVPEPCHTIPIGHQVLRRSVRRFIHQRQGTLRPAAPPSYFHRKPAYE